MDSNSIKYRQGHLNWNMNCETVNEGLVKELTGGDSISYPLQVINLTEWNKIKTTLSNNVATLFSDSINRLLSLADSKADSKADSENMMSPTLTSIQVSIDLVCELAKNNLLSINVHLCPDGSDPFTWVMWPVVGLYVIITDVGDILLEKINTPDHHDFSIKVYSISSVIEHIKKIII